MLSKSRTVALFLILTILFALFFKLPEVPQALGLVCKNCSISSPYVPLIGAFYFTFLGMLILLFPTFPSLAYGQAGLLFAVGLGAVFTWLTLPGICAICLYCHLAHSAIWGTLLLRDRASTPNNTPLSTKWALLFTAPLTIVALFSTLNFSLLVYSFAQASPLTTLVKAGEKLNLSENELFSELDLQDTRGAVFVFTSSNCPFCKELMPQIDSAAQEKAFKDIRFIALGRMHTDETKLLGSHLKWVEDREGKSFALFGVKGFPTTVVVDHEGRVLEAFAGAPEGVSEKIRDVLQQLVK